MSIVIPNMEMPKSCCDCNFCILRESIFGEQYYECVAHKNIDDYVKMNIEDVGKNHKTCPLVELPKHGRLIDADKTLDELREYLQSVLSHEPDIANRIYEIICDAPTVLEASEENEMSKTPDFTDCRCCEIREQCKTNDDESLTCEELYELVKKENKLLREQEC